MRWEGVSFEERKRVLAEAGDAFLSMEIYANAVANRLEGWRDKLAWAEYLRNGTAGMQRAVERFGGGSFVHPWDWGEAGFPLPFPQFLKVAGWVERLQHDVDPADEIGDALADRARNVEAECRVGAGMVAATLEREFAMEAVSNPAVAKERERLLAAVETFNARLDGEYYEREKEKNAELACKRLHERLTAKKIRPGSWEGDQEARAVLDEMRDEGRFLPYFQERRLLDRYRKWKRENGEG